MRVQQACRLAFGETLAEDLNFLRRARNLLGTKGINSSTAVAKRFADNCIEVRSTADSKPFFLYKDGELLHVSENMPRKRRVAHAPTLRSPNDYG